MAPWRFRLTDTKYILAMDLNKDRNMARYHVPKNQFGMLSTHVKWSKRKSLAAGHW